MTTRLYSSTSQETTLTSALLAGSGNTTLLVASASALLAGKAPGNTTPKETFVIVIDPDTALEEIVEVIYPSAPSSNTLTVVRGVDGTGAIAHSAGAKVRHMGIGRDFTEANQHAENSTSVHGLTIANVLETTDTNMITTAMLQANAVTTAKITDLNVTTGKIADSAVTSAKIADGTIVAGDIADGAITNGKLAADAVTTAKIAELAVTNSRIASDAVTADKIAADAVGTSEIADSAVTSAKIADGTIVNADINASAAIAATKIAGTAVTQADTGTVTSGMILDGTIVNGDISATAAIAKTKLNLGGTITSADLVDGTIVAADIADGTITAAKMVSDPYARANHTGTQGSSTISDLASTVKSYRLDEFAAPTNPVSANSQKVTNLGTPTSNADAATKLYVDTKVADLVNSAPSTLDTLGEIATAISAGGSVVSALVSKAGDTMTGALTLSGAPTSNLHAATKLYVDSVAGSTAAAEAAAAAAAASYDSFDDRYLGAKSTAPTLDNDGNALIEGAIYWNSVDNAMYAWTGTEWGSISSTAEIYRFRFTATGGETTISGLDDNGLTLSYLPGKEQVYLNGILLVRTTDYTASSGSSLTSLAALTAGDIVEIITFTSFEVADAIARSVFDAKGDILVGTAADTVGKLPVGSNGRFLKADSTTATGLAWSEVAGALAQPSEPSSPSDGQIWIDTDGTVGSGTQITRWYKAPTSGTTVLTGPGDNSVTLQYTAGYEQVYLNGVLLVRGTDYTATDGGTVTLSTATTTGDTVEVIGVVAVGVTDVYTQSQSDAKYVPKNLTTTTGDIIYASAANTPARLGIGSSGQVLGVSSGVPAWQAAPSSALTLSEITSGSFSGTSLSLSGLSQDFLQLHIVAPLFSPAGGTTLRIRLNNDSSNLYYYGGFDGFAQPNIGYVVADGDTSIYLTYNNPVRNDGPGRYVLTLQNCKQSGYTTFTLSAGYRNPNGYSSGIVHSGYYRSSSPITSLQFSNSNAYTIDSGTYTLIGA